MHEADAEAISALLVEAGTLADPAAIAFDPGDGSWTVALDEDRALSVAFDARRRDLVFALPLGAVPEAASARVHELLLRFNYLWQETGGLQAALDDTGAAALLYRRPLEGLDATALGALIENLSAQTELWSEVLAEPAGDGAPDTPPDLPPLSGMFV